MQFLFSISSTVHSLGCFCFVLGINANVLFTPIAGVYTFTRLLDSLVIAFIIAVFVNQLVHSTRPSITALLKKCSPLLLLSANPCVSNDNHTHHQHHPTSSISTINDCPDTSKTADVVSNEQLNQKDDTTTTQSMQSETTESSSETTTSTTSTEEEQHPLSIRNESSIMNGKVDHPTPSSSFNSADTMEQEPKSTEAGPFFPLTNSRLEQQWTSRLERHGAQSSSSSKTPISKRPPPPTPIMSFSTPVHQHHPRRYYFRDEPSPISPPALSPSLSVSSIGSTSAYEYDLVRLRRSSRVEEMIRQFDGGCSSSQPSSPMQHQRRNSVGCGPTATSSLSSSTRPLIKSRTFGFKPIVGVWEQRIAETADECSS